MKVLVKIFLRGLFHEMLSLQKTTVAVLRQVLGLSVEEFGRLIGKSASTITKLDNGSLPLSDETAHTIATETGVCLLWLLKGGPEEEPYVLDWAGRKYPYFKGHFEQVQAQKGAIPRYPLDPALYFVVSTMATHDFHSIYAAAEKAGRGELAIYRIRKVLKDLAAEMGKDDEGFLRLNADARIVAANKSEWKWVGAKDHGIEGVDGAVLQKAKGGAPTARPQQIPCTDGSNDPWSQEAATTAAAEPTREKPAAVTTTAVAELVRKKLPRKSKGSAVT
jgi:transcriptional regulator with XRE-family HTH domain